MTWIQMKLATLQKMFSASGAELGKDGATADYLRAMPGAANEGLALLCTAGKFLVKSIEIVQDGTAQGAVVRYDLRELAPELYNLAGRTVMFDDGKNRTTSHVWTLEGERYLFLPAAARGTFIIYYNAFPPEITLQTADELELPLSREAAVLLPLYMASELYKEDDAALSTG
ncbi:MAG: hypothetical protein RSF90_06940, partial [Pygmaiobacter sp.]